MKLNNKTDVLFINPPYRSKNIHVYMPMGLGYVATSMSEAGICVNIMDMNALQMSISDALLEIDRLNPPVVAITGFLTQWISILELTKGIKMLSPGSKIMLGGSLLNGAEHHLFEQSPVDAIIRGDGEILGPKLAQAFIDKTEIPQETGLAYRNGSQIVSHPGYAKVPDIDALPMLNRDLFGVQKYIDRYFNSTIGTKTLEVVWSRGCPYGCVYCINSRNDGRYRLRSVNKVIEEITFLKDRYGINDVVFASEVFSVRKDRVLELCSRLQPLSLSWTAVTRADLLDEELAEAMADAGCRWVFVGIESADDTLLDKMHKRITTEKISSAIRLIKKYKMEPRGGFIIGLPWETPATIAKARDFCIEHGLIYWPSFATAYPNTDLYEFAKPHIKDEMEYLKQLSDHHQYKKLLINLTNIPTRDLLSLKNDATSETIADYVHNENPWLPRKIIKFISSVMLSLYHSEEYLGIDIHSLMHKILRFTYLILNKKFLNNSRTRIDTK